MPSRRAYEHASPNAAFKRATPPASRAGAFSNFGVSGSSAPSVARRVSSVGKTIAYNEAGERLNPQNRVMGKSTLHRQDLSQSARRQAIMNRMKGKKRRRRRRLAQMATEPTG